MSDGFFDPNPAAPMPPFELLDPQTWEDLFSLVNSLPELGKTTTQTRELKTVWRNIEGSVRIHSGQLEYFLKTCWASFHGGSDDAQLGEWLRSAARLSITASNTLLGDRAYPAERTDALTGLKFFGELLDAYLGQGSSFGVHDSVPS